MGIKRRSLVSIFVSRFRLFLSKYSASGVETAPYSCFDRRMVELSLCCHNVHIEYLNISTSNDKLKTRKDDDKEEMLNFAI